MSVREQLQAKYGTVAPTTPASAPVGSVRASLEAKYKAPEKTTSFGGDIVRGVIKPFARVAANVANVPRVARGEEIQPLQSKYLGEIKPVGVDPNRSFGGNVLDAVGVGADIGSNLIGVSGIGGAGKALAKGVVKNVFKEVVKTPAKNVAKQFAKESFAAGATQGFGSELQDPNATVGSVLGQTALGGVIVGTTGFVLGTAGARVFRPKGALPRGVEKSIKRTEKELFNIENNYQPLRNNQKYSADGNQATRNRVARTGVVSDAPDTTGTMRTQKAIERYRELSPINKTNGVTRMNLERLGETTSLDIVEKKLMQVVLDSGIEGSELRTALNNVRKEIAGYRVRATGNKVSNVFLHDTKISTTQGIDFNTPADVKKYKKAIARGLKEVVEENSSFNVKQVNEELAPFLKDIEYLESLDGKKVKGGKLSKYAARITGNIIGSVAGGGIGGFPGSAIGTVVGGEIADRLQGRALSNTFGKASMPLPRSKILEKAIVTGNSPRLQLAAPKPGAPRKQMGSGPTINLPRRTQSTIDNQSRPFHSQKIADPNKNPKNTSIPKSKPVKAEIVNPREVAEAYAQKIDPRYEMSDNVVGTRGYKAFTQKLKELKEMMKRDANKGFISTGVYKGEKDLTTKILKDLEGKTTVSKQYILDATNRGELKQVERDLIRRILDESEPKLDGIKVYHGSKASDIIEKEGFKLMPDRSAGGYGDGIYFSTKKSDAEGYGGIVEAYLPKDIKLFEAKSSEPYTVNTKKLISEGYDGVKIKLPSGAENVTIFDPSIIKTKTQSSNTINVSDFAKKVKAELLPLKRVQMKSKTINTENVVLPDELRGNVKNYYDNVYESPIKTSAGEKHGYPTEYYTGHTRVEDMADNKTRRIIEIQDDLRQKGGLEKEVPHYLHASDYLPADKLKEYNRIERRLTDLTFAENSADYKIEIKALQKARETLEASAKDLEQKVINSRKSEVAKLAQYDNYTSPYRMVREEIKKASQDGKTKLQFPTGETAMKIEGLGNATLWGDVDRPGYMITPETLKVGKEIVESRAVPGNIQADEILGDKWIITDVLGDGKFKAVPKRMLNGENSTITDINSPALNAVKEQFDISGKVDTNNPIYKFYEKDVQKYLNKFGGKRVVDDKGVSWIEVPITKEQGSSAVEAFGRTTPGVLFPTAGISAAGMLGYAGYKKIKDGKRK